MTKRALIIDDNADNIAILAEMLMLESLEYVAIQNPTRVDSFLAQDASFDVVFLDLEMPHINGYDILEKFHADTRFHQVPIVAYTVHVSEINTARKFGFHSFLGKPLDADQFPEQLANILNDKHVWVMP
jgi:CheY-like chemotaxis protein